MSQTAAIEAASTAGRPAQGRTLRPVGWWLMGMCAVLFTMIVVGGATRLTESGLSITEWRPVTGVLPPLSEEGWQVELEKYRQIPEYQLINKGMSLEDFKVIYYWEWGHRLLGRMIGLLFAAGFAYFALTRSLGRGLTIKLSAMFVLGGLQGVLGWYMVQSGLTERVDVSQYRLVAHLGLAFVILAFMFWVALGLLIGEAGRPKRKNAVYTVAHVIGGLVFVQILVGGFVAGIRAGLIYNTWPLMDGALIPSGLWTLSPWYLNLFESHLTSQFVHRMLAYVLTFGVAVLALLAVRTPLSGQARGGVALLGGAVLFQVVLGIWTLLAVVPVWLGVAHQAGAVIVFLAALHAIYRLKPVRAPSAA